MWLPKHTNNEMYIGKMARIYYKDEYHKDGYHKDKQYIEGELIYIRKCEYSQNAYSIQILNNDNKYTKITCVNNIIKKIKVSTSTIEVDINKLNENIYNICKKYLAEDVGNIINQYVGEYIEI